MKRKSFLLSIFLFLCCFSTAFGTGLNTGATKTTNESAGKFDDFAHLCFAAKCTDDCETHYKNNYMRVAGMTQQWNAEHPDNKIVVKNPGDLAAICHQVNNPPDFKEIQQIYQANGGSRYPQLTSGCPCPGGIQVKQDGCSITFVCKIGGDTNAELTATTPCPVVRGSDPKYPLVKMLSGTLIEWNGTGSVSAPTSISFGAPGGLSSPGAYVGAEYYQAKYTVTLSSIDLGENVKFDLTRADSKKNAKNPLDRSNFIFELVGNQPYVEVLDQRDIYEAYKTRSNYVQAYLALENKGWGERPWNTYEKFIDGMCDMSSNKSRCKKELAYYGHRDTGMQGNLYLGNGDMSILGLYSEISSIGCHGVTVLNDKGQDAFAISIKSTWCFYVHAEYQAFSWQITESKYIGECCDDWKWEKVGEVENCHVEHDEQPECHTDDVMEWQCKHYQKKYTVKYGWETAGSGSSSSGDCGICRTATGYIDEKGKMTTEPLGISFYQSQPLLIR